jgi:hypothetical protein
VPELKQLVTGFPPRRPGFASGQSMWVLWWTKRHWGRFSPSTSVSPANHHSTKFSILIITRGWQNRPIGGRNAEWAQLDSTIPLYQLKKIKHRDNFTARNYEITCIDRQCLLSFTVSSGAFIFLGSCYINILYDMMEMYPYN